MMRDSETPLDRAIDTLGDQVGEAVKHMNAFLAYQGDNPKFLQKAKIAAVLLSTYVKAEATKTNRMQVDLVAERMRMLPEGHSRELPALRATNS